MLARFTNLKNWFILIVTRAAVEMTKKHNYKEESLFRIREVFFQTMFQSNRNSVRGFFLAGRNMLWWPVGISTQNFSDQTEFY